MRSSDEDGAAALRGLRAAASMAPMRRAPSRGELRPASPHPCHLPTSPPPPPSPFRASPAPSPLQAWQAAGRMTARRLYHVHVQRLCWALALPWRAVTRTRPMACRLPLCACVAAGLVRTRMRMRAWQPHRQHAQHAVRATLQVPRRCRFCCTCGASRSVRRPGRRVGVQLPLPAARAAPLPLAAPAAKRPRSAGAESAVRRAALLAAGVSQTRRRNLWRMAAAV